MITLRYPGSVMVLRVDGWPPERVPSVQGQARLGIGNLGGLPVFAAQAHRSQPVFLPWRRANSVAGAESGNAAPARADERPTGST